VLASALPGSMYCCASLCDGGQLAIRRIALALGALYRSSVIV